MMLVKSMVSFRENRSICEIVLLFLVGFGKIVLWQRKSKQKYWADFTMLSTIFTTNERSQISLHNFHSFVQFFSH